MVRVSVLRLILYAMTETFPTTFDVVKSPFHPDSRALNRRQLDRNLDDDHEIVHNCFLKGRKPERAVVVGTLRPLPLFARLSHILVEWASQESKLSCTKQESRSPKI